MAELEASPAGGFWMISRSAVSVLFVPTGSVTAATFVAFLAE